MSQWPENVTQAMTAVTLLMTFLPFQLVDSGGGGGDMTGTRR